MYAQLHYFFFHDLLRCCCRARHRACPRPHRARTPIGHRRALSVRPLCVRTGTFSWLWLRSAPAASPRLAVPERDERDERDDNDNDRQQTGNHNRPRRRTASAQCAVGVAVDAAALSAFLRVPLCVSPAPLSVCTHVHTRNPNTQTHVRLAAPHRTHRALHGRTARVHCTGAPHTPHCTHRALHGRTVHRSETGTAQPCPRGCSALDHAPVHHEPGDRVRPCRAVRSDAWAG